MGIDHDRSDTESAARISRRTALKIGAIASVGFVGATGSGGATDDRNREQVDSILEELTLEEKLARTHGVDEGPEGAAGYLQGVERLDVPGMVLADGPPGVVTAEPATAFPHPIAAAATFDPDLIESEGKAIGREAKDADVSVMLGPSMDVFRVPLHSRSAETFGEDPYLSSRMAAAHVGGVQSEGVIATLKHFTAYNQTRSTGDVADYFSTSEHDVRVDERALREIYLPPFEAGVTEGNAGAVMTAYNRINGTFASEHPRLLSDVLKDEWGFDGFTVSDWYGTHSTVDAATAGLDVEMPDEQYFGDSLAEAVESGDIEESVVDDMARRTLNAQHDIGALTGDRHGSEPARGTDEHFRLAERIAAEGTVLLKNDDEFLPLDADAIDEVALVGPTTDEFKTTVGGSEDVPEIRTRGPVDGLEDVVGDSVDVTAVDTDRRELVAADDGFDYEYYEESLEGEPIETGTIDSIDFDGDAGAAVWEGTVTAPETGSFGFALTSQGESTLLVDGEVVTENLGGGFMGPETVQIAVDLERGVEYDVRVEATGGAPVRLAWNPPSALDEAVAAAADADVALVLGRTDTTYGDDRVQFDLPSNQNALVERVAAANENTAVLVNAEAPVAMPWVDAVPAVLQLWLPGQEAGTAVAKLLFGEATPSGKLPVTVARTLEDYLPTEIDVVPNDARGYPGVDGTVYYDEGVFVGYRHFDENGIEPLFPFGHGESYAEFEYSELQLQAVEGGLEASVTVENVGDYDGREAVQLYVRDVDARVERPPKELAAIDKVAVDAGDSERVTLRVDVDDLAFYDEDAGEWVVEPGAFEVAVGRSSRDLRLEGRFAVDDEERVVAAAAGRRGRRDDTRRGRDGSKRRDRGTDRGRGT